jgi:hypothetical protein
MAIVIPTSLGICNSHWMTSTKDPMVGVAWWQTFLGYIAFRVEDPKTKPFKHKAQVPNLSTNSQSQFPSN